MVRHKQALAGRGRKLSTSPLMHSNLHHKMNQRETVRAPFPLEEMGIGSPMCQLQSDESEVCEGSRPQSNG